MPLIQLQNPAIILQSKTEVFQFSQLVGESYSNRIHMPLQNFKLEVMH